MTSYKTLLALSISTLAMLGACTIEHDRDFDDEDRADDDPECGVNNTAAATSSIDCNHTAIEQYVYVKNNDGRTTRIKRFACDDMSAVTPWVAIEDAPGDATHDSVVGAASLMLGGLAHDYVLSSNGNAYYRTRQPLQGTKSHWADIGDTADIPRNGNDPKEVPNQMAIYTDVNDRRVMSVGFKEYGLFRGLGTGTPHQAPHGLMGRGLPVSRMHEMGPLHWLEVWQGKRYVYVDASEVSGPGVQLAHSTFMGHIGNDAALIQGIWKDGNGGEAYYRWDSETQDGSNFNEFACDTLASIAKSWPEDTRANTPTATDNFRVFDKSVNKDQLVESAADTTIVVTPEIKATQHIEPFTIQAMCDEQMAPFGWSCDNSVAGIAVKAVLGILKASANPDTPTEFSTPQDFDRWALTKEHRCYQDIPIWDLTCRNGQVEQWSPPPERFSYGYTRGPGGAFFNAGDVYIETDYNGQTESVTSNRACVEILDKRASRLAHPERVGVFATLGYDQPFIWNEVAVTACCDGSMRVHGDHSTFPEARLFVDGVQKDRDTGESLGQFMQETGQQWHEDGYGPFASESSQSIEWSD